MAIRFKQHPPGMGGQGRRQASGHVDAWDTVDGGSRRRREPGATARRAGRVALSGARHRAIPRTGARIVGPGPPRLREGRGHRPGWPGPVGTGGRSVARKPVVRDALVRLVRASPERAHTPCLRMPPRQVRHLRVDTSMRAASGQKRVAIGAAFLRTSPGVRSMRCRQGRSRDRNPGDGPGRGTDTRRTAPFPSEDASMNRDFPPRAHSR